MATYFVRSSGGDDTNTGLAWDAALATVEHAIASHATVAGDIIVVDLAVNETAAGVISVAGGSRTASKALISATPQAGAGNVDIVYAAGAKLKSTGAMTFYQSWDMYGMTLETSSNGALVLCGSTVEGYQQNLYNCTLIPVSYIGIGGIANRLRLYSCNVTGGTLSTNIMRTNNYGNIVKWVDGTISYTNTSSSYAFFYGAYGGQLEFCGVDLSSLEDLVDICTPDAAAGSIVFRGCKVPSTWASNIGTLTAGLDVLVERSDYADRTQTSKGLGRYASENGVITHDTGTYRTGGANDGDDDYSWKMVGDATYCTYRKPLATPPITVWCDQSNPASPETYTVTVHFGSDTTLTDQNFWIDILYPATTATHQDGFDTSRGVVYATGAEYDAGGTWTDDTAGSFTPYKWELSFAPAYPGPITIRAYVAGNLTAYVCPNIEIA